MKRYALIVQLLFSLVLIPLSLLPSSSVAAPLAQDAPWVLINVRTLTLTVLSQRNHVLARFTNIAIGSGGFSRNRRRGDDKTPLGVFRVAWINPHSRFKIFFGLDWPNPDDARRAYLKGDLSLKEYHAVAAAFREHRIPPQDTVLGGQIGIHGLGSGSPLVQAKVNWTDGCIALTNPQIRALSHWVQIGTRVVIR